MKKSIVDFFPDATRRNWQDWRWQMKNRVSSLPALARNLNRPDSFLTQLRPVVSVYPLAVTPYYLSLVSPGDENDPLARQFVPDIRELTAFVSCLPDPLHEDALMPVPGLIHRYPDRVLAMVTRTCAMHCRHCNRKRYWTNRENASLKSRLQKMVRYVENAPQIREVILSGGDPLVYDDETLEMMVTSFASIPHVDVLRIGSRVPVVLPMRITKELCRMLKRYRPLWFNIQFNHPSEITKDAARACNMIQETGVPVSNQSVLLKGVNDSPEVMRDLLTGLQKISVRPYYLFHCEPVRGCGHFRTPVRSGLKMMENLRQQCSGLAMPQYVADLPGDAGKIPLWGLSGSIKNDLRKHQDFFDFFE